MKSGRDNAKARIPSASTAESTGPAPAEGSGGAAGFDEVLRSLGGGAGGGGGTGGLDIASMLQNPMLQNMAQQLMQNGGLENLMRNPALSNMVRCHGVPRNTFELLTFDHLR